MQPGSGQISQQKMLKPRLAPTLQHDCPSQQQTCDFPEQPRQSAPVWSVHDVHRHALQTTIWFASIASCLEPMPAISVK